MSRWLTYLKERSPWIPLLLLCEGILASESALTGRVRWLHVGAPLWILLTYFVLLRLMDELKDFEKDRVAHPTRPLPRGLLQPREVERAVLGLALVLAACGAAYAASGRGLAGALLLISVGYAWLMYREFYAGPGLASRPFLYAATHQIVIWPLYAFPLAATNPEPLARREFLAWLAYNLTASFAYELSRKLDPKALPILRTYRSVHGARVTLSVAAVLILLGTAAAWWGGVIRILGPFQGLALLSLIWVWKDETKYKWAEGMTILACTVSLWALALGTWL